MNRDYREDDINRNSNERYRDQQRGRGGQQWNMDDQRRQRNDYDYDRSRERDFGLRDIDENRNENYNLGTGTNMRSGRRERNDWNDESREGRGMLNRGIDRLQGFFGKGPKGWRRSDDQIKEEACQALHDSWEVDASNIEVTVKDASVILRGSVDSRDAKREAERCIDRIRGVEDVQNELKVMRNENVTEMRKPKDAGRTANLS